MLLQFGLSTRSSCRSHLKGGHLDSSGRGDNITGCWSWVIPIKPALNNKNVLQSTGFQTQGSLMRSIEQSLNSALESLGVDCTNLLEVQNFVDSLYPVVPNKATATKKHNAVTFFYRPKIELNNVKQ